ncbi:hypothetical protein ABZX93_35080 [Streptomyces sp. NPDC006632]|uniref:hypothetical protein n=1 Tax=Streptomyces sp. NPDC006632 TaxID=3157182 RepID=UPI0033B673AA
MKMFNTADDFRHDKDAWEAMITKRREILEEAREMKDMEYVKLAEERLDSALDGYSRDCR